MRMAMIGPGKMGGNRTHRLCRNGVEVVGCDRAIALHMRFTSQDKKGYGFRMLSMMRNAFGGHAVAQTS